ncbi:zinc transporter ZupT [Mycoplasmoides fastidiosum]|uniref:Zinc transporter ZupT n=1 Tax=Mycoplasmoides fastidiosum TaxID=92758 RepID=A0ABU0M039_9BACT|nr:ZIP family metal transporter [Mycoplasmoides fastidiosum]MDQ0514308.1 zinc transporter ZupT [Mycoplasmoides fastidiosum]UUD38088.1 ZIP family metal transporter [Mycoplasmoides fastidiosum]
MFNGIIINSFSAYGNYNFNALILSLIIISVPVLITVLAPLVKATLSKKATMLLYAFTIGFFLVLGLYGESNEGLHFLQDGYPDHPHLIGIQVGVIAGGALLGLAGALFFKFLISKKLKVLNWNQLIHHTHQHDSNQHDHHQFHHHAHGEDYFLDRANSAIKNKYLAIYLLLSHRVGAGLFLGYTVYQIVSGLGGGISVTFIIGFFIHVIPEELILYYRMREMQIPKWRAMGYSLWMSLLLVPFIFIGANLGTFIGAQPWIQALLHIIVGVLFSFVALVELLPEVIAEAKTQKLWYLAIILLILGMISAFLVMNLHVHEHGGGEASSSLFAHPLSHLAPKLRI